MSTQSAGLERRTRSAPGVHSTRQSGTERLCRELQRAIARWSLNAKLVHELEPCAEKDRRLAATGIVKSCDPTVRALARGIEECDAGGAPVASLAWRLARWWKASCLFGWPTWCRWEYVLV